MDAGRLDKRAVILRRPILRDEDGEETGRGDYVPAFTIWANFRPQSVREATQGGAARNVETGTLAIRDSVQARGITNGERVTLQGRDFNIDGVGLPDRRTGMILLNISSSLGGE